jgi:AraC-like DNA-binding protein
LRLLNAAKRYIESHAGESPYVLPVDGLMLLRSTERRMRSHLVFKPSLCVTLQGAKRSTFGAQSFEYRAGEALVVSIALPAQSEIIDASAQEPYLGLVLELDVTEMHEFVETLALQETNGDAGFAVHHIELTPQIEDCLTRLVRLAETPDAIGFVAPLVRRELNYWLLAGPQGAQIARLAVERAHRRSLIDAVHKLRAEFDKPVRIEGLARKAGMSPTTFHREFKAFTSMTPLQYQKRLRLHAARSMMLSGEANVEAAAYTVGYESASQFSREYARTFGVPPRRDIGKRAG